MDREEHTFCGVSRDFFFLDFKNMSGKGTITISGGNNSLIQKPLKSRNSGYITKLRSKVKTEENDEEVFPVRLRTEKMSEFLHF